MDDAAPFDWDPRSPAVQRDQIAAYDAMRARCPVARSRYGYTSLFRHADVLQVLADPETFSSEVSKHAAIPNGLDPPRHTAYRRLIDRYFTPERMAAFEPACQHITQELIDALPAAGESDFMRAFAWPFAVRVQCAFMGWPAALEEPLAQWTRKNHAATYAIDPDAMARVAREFDALLDALLAERRNAAAAAPDDVTTRLIRETIEDRPLSDEEIISIARNWTVGEISTIAASVGIVVGCLCEHPVLQSRLRSEAALVPAAIDEILRLHGPLVLNRRRVMRPTTIRGRLLLPGERLALLWPSANRDENTFKHAHEFRLDRDPSANLLYGAGIHVCPGAPLARLELRVMLDALVAQTVDFSAGTRNTPTRASYPASGFATLPVRIQKRAVGRPVRKARSMANTSPARQP